MKNMRTKHDTIDIYSDEQLPTIDEVVVFTENEYGMASLLAGTTIIGDREPDATVMSHLLSEMAFNAAPKMAKIGWEIYFEKNTEGQNIAFVMLTNWPNVQVPSLSFFFVVCGCISDTVILYLPSPVNR